MYTTKDLKKISDRHKYDSIKKTADYMNALKENESKSFKDKIQYRLDNLNSRNKYSSLAKTNTAWFITELFVFYVVSGESEWNITLTPIQTIVALIIVTILAAFNALRCARVYKLGIYKKSNMFFLIMHTIMFLAGLLYFLE